MQRTFQYWIATKWLELDQDNLHMKFSALNVDFSSLSPDPLGSWSPAQAGVKDGYPSWKVDILPQLSGVAWKWLQIGTDMLFIINFCNLRLQHKIQDWTAMKKLETDWQLATRNCYRLSCVSWELAQISCLDWRFTSTLSNEKCTSLLWHL